MMLKRLAPALLALALLPACAATPAEDGAPAEQESGTDQALAGWTTIGFGVNYKKVGDGNDVVIVYGGYTAKDAYVAGWSDALVAARLGAAGYAHVYAVRGPNQSAYANQEIQNSKLAAHLKTTGIGDGATNLLVIAHSSGTFVATELVQMLARGRGGQGALAKVTLMNLDGGGIDGSLLSQMKNAYFVWAHDGDIGRSSHNASSMIALGQKYAQYGGAIEVDATGSGCDAHASGGLWCLHDTLITTKPHNPAMYDLADDYTDFSEGGPQVVTSYLDGIVAAPAQP